MGRLGSGRAGRQNAFVNLVLALTRFGRLGTRLIGSIMFVLSALGRVMHVLEIRPLAIQRVADMKTLLNMVRWVISMVLRSNRVPNL